MKIELFVAGGIAFPHGGEVLIPIAKEQNLAVVAVGIGFDGGDAVQGSAFEIQLHHDANRLGEPGVHADGQIELADRRGKAPVRPRCQGRGVGVHRSEAPVLLPKEKH